MNGFNMNGHANSTSGRLAGKNAIITGAAGYVFVSYPTVLCDI
jgi:hypothetical protein